MWNEHTHTKMVKITKMKTHAHEAILKKLYNILKPGFKGRTLKKKFQQCEKANKLETSDLVEAAKICDDKHFKAYVEDLCKQDEQEFASESDVRAKVRRYNLVRPLAYAKNYDNIAMSAGLLRVKVATEQQRQELREEIHQMAEEAVHQGAYWRGTVLHFD